MHLHFFLGGIKIRIRLLLILAILLASTSFSTANPGGEGDGIRSMECGGSCHGDSSQNGISPASIEVVASDEVWAGLFTTVTVYVNDSQPSDNRLVGAFLLVNEQGAKDTPAHDGWEIVAGPNGGTGNYAELFSSYSTDSASFTWTLRAPDAGTYSLLATVHHGSENGGTAFQGQSSTITVIVEEPPENLPRLADSFTPPATRELGKETIITLQTENVNSMTVEYRVDEGTPVSIPIVDDKFTLPAAINPGVVEWRVHLEGEGPDQTSPWFRLVAEEPGWEVDETTLFLQGFAMLILCVGLLQIQRPKTTDNKQYDMTDQVPVTQAPMFGAIAQPPVQQLQANPGPPLPASGLPVGWTMEQWAHYGQEHLDSLQGGGQS